MNVPSLSALVLDTVRYREADLIVKMLSPFGPLTALAYSACKSRSRFPSGIDRLTMVEAVISKGHRMPVMRSAITKEVYWRIKEDFDKSCAASLFAEMLLRSHYEPDEGESIFRLASSTLFDLDRCHVSETWPRILHAVLRLLQLLGFLPPQVRCRQCEEAAAMASRLEATEIGEKREGRVGASYFLDPQTGEVRCSRHRTAETSLPLPPPYIAFLDAALSSPSFALFLNAAPSQALPEARGLLLYLGPLLENLVSANLKSLAFLARYS